MNLPKSPLIGMDDNLFKSKDNRVAYNCITISHLTIQYIMLYTPIPHINGTPSWTWRSYTSPITVESLTQHTVHKLVPDKNIIGRGWRRRVLFPGQSGEIVILSLGARWGMLCCSGSTPRSHVFDCRRKTRDPSPPDQNSKYGTAQRRTVRCRLNDEEDMDAGYSVHR